MSIKRHLWQVEPHTNRVFAPAWLRFKNMESLEVVSDNSLPSHECVVVVPSSSYNDQVIATDAGSVTSASLQGTRSPARSPPSSQRTVDLLDNSQGFPSTRERSGVSSDDDHTDPSSSATGNDAGYRRSDLEPKLTSSFGRLIENTKVSGM